MSYSHFTGTFVIFLVLTFAEVILFSQKKKILTPNFWYSSVIRINF